MTEPDDRNQSPGAAREPPAGRGHRTELPLVDAPMPSPHDGEVLVKNEWLSLDPYMRGRMSDAKSYVPPAKLDEPMTGQTVGEVLESRDPAVQAGRQGADRRSAGKPTASPGRAIWRRSTRVALPASYYLGVLGMPGITAWFGLQRDRAAEARRDGGRVGGVRRGRQRRRPAREAARAAARSASRAARRSATTSCDELGFDACVDYKAGNLARRPARRLPRRRRRRLRERRRRGPRHRCCA